jgi:hypothetical protein
MHPMEDTSPDAGNNAEVRLEDALDAKKQLKNLSSYATKACVLTTIGTAVVMGILDLINQRKGDLLNNVAIPLAVGMGSGSFVTLCTTGFRRHYQGLVERFLASASADDLLTFEASKM